MQMLIYKKMCLSSSGEVNDVFNPVTGDLIDQTPLATQQDIDEAVSSARNALEKWRNTPV
ncbi:aldehyde dehydrogenase family protein, partial [Oceanispirochaeta sp.]|uniref:aldehyde dehydrogenase family protein n=1 Tax=Oceanispirochaeta sp. TaxID=2035350 RepID=UPI00345D218D